MILLKIFSLAILINTLWTESIYKYSIEKIEGGNRPLQTYQGKKILIITLPIERSPSADSLLYSLDTLGAAHAATISIVAVPSFENGYTQSKKNQLRQWYRSIMGNHILITEGLYTSKTSHGQQHPLFKWLTTVTLNESFDIDVSEPGFKFFIKENGELYGLLRPHTHITSRAVNDVIRM